MAVPSTTAASNRPRRSRRQLQIWFTMIAALCGFALATTASQAASLKGYGFVNDDGTLRIRGKTVHLYGIHIPETARICKTNFRPPRCGTRAAVALKFKLNHGWPHCELTKRNRDRSVIAKCLVDGTDLSAYLLRFGWAVALPDAPIEYQALEKIARSRGFGVWGIALGE